MGDSSSVVLDATLTTNANNTISLAGTSTDVLHVHAGEQMHVRVQLDPSATVPYANISRMNHYMPAPLRAMKPVSGEAGVWTLDFTQTAPPQGNVLPGIFSVSVQAKDAAGRTVSAPVGVFYYSQ
jgi:hypothetical protein